MLTICLLLVYFVSAAGCHCFDSEIILHVGTNDVNIHSAEEVADNIIKLTDDIKKKGIWYTVSSLVVRADSELLKSAVIDVNNVLRDSLPLDVNFVEHSYITDYHLNNSRLYLNYRGDTPLAHTLSNTSGPLTVQKRLCLFPLILSQLSSQVIYPIVPYKLILVLLIRL